MESAVANLCRPATRVVVVSAGHFGERWEKIAARTARDVEPLRYEWGETPRADEVAARLAELGGADVVFLTQSETSTGVVADVQALAAVAKQAGALVASTRSRASAPSRSRWTPGVSTSSSPDRRRR